MRRRKVLTAIMSLVAVCGLALVLVMISNPSPAVSHPGYAWKPGCHCGAPKTTPTTKRPTTPTTRKPATATTKTAPKPAATTPARVSTTTATSQTTTTATTVDASSTSTDVSATSYPSSAADHNAGLEVAAGAASVLGSGGDPPSGSTPGDGSGTGSVDGSAGGVDASQLTANAFAPKYYVSPVAIIFLLVYGATFWLYRTGRMRVVTHRKIWNALLVVTFLITGIFGLILAISISRNPPMQLPSWLLFWHVEAGIVMCFISLFHLSWHARYYARMLVPQRADRRERDMSSRSGLREVGRSRPAFDYIDEARQARRTDERGRRGR